MAYFPGLDPEERQILEARARLALFEDSRERAFLDSASLSGWHWLPFLLHRHITASAHPPVCVSVSVSSPLLVNTLVISVELTLS